MLSPSLISLSYRKSSLEMCQNSIQNYNNSKWNMFGEVPSIFALAFVPVQPIVCKEIPVTQIATVRTVSFYCSYIPDEHLSTWCASNLHYIQTSTGCQGSKPRCWTILYCMVSPGQITLTQSITQHLLLVTGRQASTPVCPRETETSADKQQDLRTWFFLAWLGFVAPGLHWTVTTTVEDLVQWTGKSVLLPGL